MEDIDGRIVPQRNYNDLAPDHREFDGIKLARQHGGWGQSKPTVEFHHTLAEIMNAAISASFRLERIEESQRETEGALADLPDGFTSLWMKVWLLQLQQALEACGAARRPYHGHI
ncbi:MAG: hypothetical protein QGI49_09040 [SAR202 cluster bacterium]|nr:hypothetical protein [SAR202 cluster bacterium]